MDQSDFLSGAEVRALLGGVSEKTLARYSEKHWHCGIHYVPARPKNPVYQTHDYRLDAQCPRPCSASTGHGSMVAAAPAS